METSGNVAGTLQDIIDDNKENFTSEVYMQLSNALMNAHQNSKRFYEASLIIPKFIPANDSVVILEHSVQKHIIHLENKVADSYIQDIEDNGHVAMCTHTLPSVDDSFSIYDTNSERFLDEDGEPNPEIYQTGSELQCIQCNMHVITCIRLKPICDQITL
tara:strand:+ start:1044 stop:1523 length:480 start_codon:yes stop_codon:yes gene_type:complete